MKAIDSADHVPAPWAENDPEPAVRHIPAPESPSEWFDWGRRVGRIEQMAHELAREREA